MKASFYITKSDLVEIEELINSTEGVKLISALDSSGNSMIIDIEGTTKAMMSLFSNSYFQGESNG